MTGREAALAILERCRRDGAWLSAAADGLIRRNALSKREAALASAIALGVLQNGSYFDFLIGSFCTTKPEKLEKKVLEILRIGVCQLLLLDRIPARAAVNETVALCETAGVGRAGALVNAVLRRIAEARSSLPEVPGRGEPVYLATRYSQPLWLAEKLVGEKGYDFTEACFAAFTLPSALDIQINTLRTTRADYVRALERLGIGYEIPSFPENCLRIAGGAVNELPGFEEGLFYVQDRAARMAIDLAGPGEGMRVLDACASPGGKSFAAALAMHGTGEIVSCDIHEKKLPLIRSGAERLGLTSIRTECRDAREFVPEWENAFDLVLADVPCSGFGVIGKKPEIRFKDPGRLKALSGIQRAILDNLCRFVRPGGVLLYSTCTILREENEDVIASFLAAHGGFRPCEFEVDGRGSRGGCYTFYPNVDGTDGFFVSKLQRK